MTVQYCKATLTQPTVTVTRSAIKKTGIGVVVSLDLDSLFAPLRACHWQPGHVSVSDPEQRSFRLVKVVVYY